MAPAFFIIAMNELRGIVRQKRVIVTVTLVPLLLLPMFLLGMGYFFVVSESKLQERVFNVAVDNRTYGADLMQYVEDSSNYSFRVVNSSDPIEDISNELIELYINFPQDFTDKIENNLTGELILRYSSAIPASVRARDEFIELVWDYRLDQREKRLSESNLTLDILNVVNTTYKDTATSEEKSGSIMGTILPYFVVIYLMSGAMSIGLDAVAGEKERNTLGTLLVNKVSRSSIVIGKIISVMVVSFVSSIFTIGGLGLILAGGVLFGSGDAGSPFAAFTPWVILGLLLILVPLSAVLVSLIILVGTFARNLKEASSYMTPVFFVVIFIGIMTMSISYNITKNVYLIPIASSVFAMKDILLGKLTISLLIVNLVVTVLCAAILIYLCVRMFKSEKILFRI